MPTAERSALAHLYRRAGVGAWPEQLDAAERAGSAATVARLRDFGAVGGGGACADPGADAAQVARAKGAESPSQLRRVARGASVANWKGQGTPDGAPRTIQRRPRCRSPSPISPP